MKYKQKDFINDFAALLKKYCVDNEEYENVNERFYVPIENSCKAVEGVNVLISTYMVRKEKSHEHE